MTLKVNIRNVQIDDFEFIFDALQQLHVNLNKNIFFENFKNKIKIKKSWMFVAENLDAQKLGFIICENLKFIHLKQEVIIISHFYIAPNYRKMKVADLLYEFVETKAIDYNIKQVLVMCNITATTTQNFYTKHKFKFDKKTYLKIL
jgi:ribosomal protein S18 acetylase RimI-like enzyme